MKPSEYWRRREATFQYAVGTKLIDEMGSRRSCGPDYPH
jgi:hypothetical protein